LTPGVVAALQVARFYNVSPDVVENWPNPDFLDREEFMFIQYTIDDHELEKSRGGKG
jgi:hypothetical protein